MTRVSVRLEREKIRGKKKAVVRNLKKNEKIKAEEGIVVRQIIHIAILSMANRSSLHSIVCSAPDETG